MTNNFTNDLLSKFDEVVINNENRISDTDKKYCEKQQEYYESASELLENTLHSYKELYAKQIVNDKDRWSNENGFISSYDDINPLTDRITKIKHEFIYRIVRHFSDTYNVTLNSEKIEKQLKETKVHYDMILDRIFDQLEGFTFEDKAVQEIKDNIRELIKYQINNGMLEVKKNKLIIPDFTSIDYIHKKIWGTAQMGYGSQDNVKTLLVSLSHFENETNELMSVYENILDRLRHDDCYEKYEVTSDKVKSIKFFQNGKVEIMFNTQLLAEQFKNEYLLG